MISTPVTVDNFVRVETDHVFARVQADAGGINLWSHNRQPTALDHQLIIRQNRDTLYSGAVIDASKGVVITIPDAGDRYQSVMVVNEDHYLAAVLHVPGEHSLTSEQVGTDYALIAVRILVDPADPADVAAVNHLQDGLGIRAGSAQPFELPDYDEASYKSTRQPLIELGRGIEGFDGAFGTKDTVDPVRHLIATANAWGGLPIDEAFYLNIEPGSPVGEYKLTGRDVPVDAFWSITVYNADGQMEPSEQGGISLNSITATPDADGSITTHFGGYSDARTNCLSIMKGWNYVVRLYRPRPQVIDGSWQFLSVESV